MKAIISRKASQKKEKLDLKAKTPFKVKTSIKVGRTVFEDPYISVGSPSDQLVCTNSSTGIV